MHVIVTGFESSGTKWMTELLQKHPRIGRVTHTSIPEYLMCHRGGTRWPMLGPANFVVWVIRDDLIRKKSVARLGYAKGRTARFLPPQLYEAAETLLARVSCPLVPVSY